MQKQKTNKKAQEEMVGFVLIMVIVAVIFVIFLGISLRNNKETSLENIEVSQFLDTMLSYTTDCAINFEPAYSSIQDLIRECDKGSICTSNKDACEVLTETAEELIEESWAGKIGPGAPYSGYFFRPISAGETIEDSSVFDASGTTCKEVQTVQVEKPLPGNRSVYFHLCESVTT